MSFGIGQQIVLFAPVGDHTNSDENVALVRSWLFDPANAIPLMVRKLSGSFHDPNNPGTTEEERIIAALSRYNSGQWIIPSKYSGNLASYMRALVQADEILGEL